MENCIIQGNNACDYVNERYVFCLNKTIKALQEKTSRQLSGKNLFDKYGIGQEFPLFNSNFTWDLVVFASIKQGLLLYSSHDHP